MIVGVVFVRRLSPLKFTIIQTKETTQEAVSPVVSFARVSIAPGRTGVSEWSGQARKAEPGLAWSRVSQEGVSHHPSPSWSG